MRKLALWALLTCSFVATAQEAKNITIKGEVDGVKRGRLYLLLNQGDNRVDTLAATDFKKSRFKISAKIDEPLVTQLVLDGYQGGFTLFVEPGESYEARLTNDNSAYIKGGRLNEAYTAHMRVSDSLQAKINTLQQRYDSLRAASKFRSASRVNDTLRICKNSWQQLTDDFLSQNDNLITAYTVYSNIMMRDLGAAESRRMYSSMGEGAKATHCASLIRARIKKLEKLAQNATAPDFTASTPDGTEVTMSCVKGKIKILDFWTSWCGPCRMNNPALKALYEEYHPKGLEIIGVSLDNNAEKWKAAIEKDGLTWVNVSTLGGWNCSVARLYNVKSVPALFVLDENNRIIASGLRGEKLREFIKERLDF